MTRPKQLVHISIHLIFWVCSYLFITRNDITWGGLDNTQENLPIAYGYGLLFNALIFYGYIFWLVPKYFMKAKKKLFWIYAIVFLVFVTLIESYLDILLVERSNPNLFQKYEGKLGHTFLVLNFLCHLFYSLVGFLFRFQFEYFKSEKAKNNLLLENQEAELKYLRAQLNPHFLFNAINSVYHLIGRDDTLAKTTLMQFSGLLRYQLYENTTGYIALERELAHVLEYVKIEATRKGEDIHLNYDIACENPETMVAPLFLIPFIENAFKHCSNHLESTKNTITIRIKEVNKKLILNVSNSFPDLPKKATNNGLGLKNVMRRLDLVYLNNYELDIRKEEGIFSVFLSILI